MDTPPSGESNRQPKHGLFTLVFGCNILAILLTGSAVLIARFLPLN
jgi:hypothetical protein